MSDQSMIENVNHTSNRLLTPDGSLATSFPDSDEQLVSRKVYEREIKEEIKEQYKEQIRGLNRNRMRANRQGEVKLWLTVDDELVETSLKIRAIPEPIREALEEPLKELHSLIPQRWEKEATWDEDRKLWEPGYVSNLEHPDYPEFHRKQMKAVRLLTYGKAIYGLAEPFMDGQKVIWDSNQAYKYNKDANNVEDVYNIDHAIEYLNDIGMSYEQVTEIARAVEVGQEKKKVLG